MHCFDTHRPVLLRPHAAQLAVSGLLLASGLLFLLATPAVAQEEREAGWYDTAELSLVATGGNSESTTLGFRNLLERVWERALLTVEASGLRAETTITSRLAAGTPADFRISETSTDELTAENYYLGARYDRELSARLFWFASGDWQRNEFAGFSSRTTLAGGIGHTWWSRQDSQFRTTYGVTRTTQDDLVADPAQDDSFLGVRLGYDYRRKLTATTTFQSALQADGNADETEDWRAKLVESLAVAISERLALKLSLELNYDNLPSLVAIPLLDAAGEPTGDRVRVPLDELDSQFTVALVVSF